MRSQNAELGRDVYSRLTASTSQLSHNTMSPAVLCLGIQTQSTSYVASEGSLINVRDVRHNLGSK